MNNSDPGREPRTWVEVYLTTRGTWRWSRVTSNGERSGNAADHPTQAAAISAARVLVPNSEVRCLMAECD